MHKHRVRLGLVRAYQEIRSPISPTKSTITLRFESGKTKAPPKSTPANRMVVSVSRHHQPLPSCGKPGPITLPAKPLHLQTSSRAPSEEGLVLSQNEAWSAPCGERNSRSAAGVNPGKFHSGGIPGQNRILPRAVIDFSEQKESKKGYSG